MPNVSNTLGEAGKEASTRPERRFEKRRLFWLLLLVGISLSCIVFLFQKGTNPMSGVENIGAQSSHKTPTVSAGMNLNATFNTTPMYQPASASVPTRSSSGIWCRVMRDVETSAGVMPQGSRVMATGFTFAKGQLVEIIGGTWISQTLVMCENDVLALEKPYVQTPTPIFSSTPGRPLPAAVRVVTSVVIVTTTPAPTSAISAPVTSANGLYFDDGGCVVINLQGVRQIWINGKGVSVGRYCDVIEIKVIK